MSTRTLGLDDRLYGYLLAANGRETPIQARLRHDTHDIPGAGMQISPELGQFLGLVVRMIGARLCLEVGTFTGYSTLSVALALPADGHIVACDINEHTTALAQSYWAEAGVASKIHLRIAPALNTLDLLIADHDAGGFDFAFIDADKSNYDAYYERCLTLLRPGGVIAIDNVLWSGKVADEHVQDEDTVALRHLNAKIAQDGRVDSCLVPIGDGLTLARKR
ncbi:MAG: SAM-dependent methyltransferase [Alphaproteobacteria bacterium]|nr:class I SAM-dependent methyltransferase [Alphaproteobacteria bacterium]TAD88431.1 MAG: SAM-dependent methyltransferase [Alphaproteobacteria bacterium]